MNRFLQRAAALLLCACGLASAADTGAKPAPPDDPLLTPFVQPASYAT